MSGIRRRAWISLGSSLCVTVTLSSCRILPVTSTDKKSDRPAVDSRAVYSLQRQIREREQRIVELEAQLNALKVIDQEVEKQRQSSIHPRR